MGEENFPGQDESTLRPADNQDCLDDDVCFTAGDARMANGQYLPAFLYVIEGELSWIDVYPEPTIEDTWSLSLDARLHRWVAINDEWFLEDENGLQVDCHWSGLESVSK